MLFRSNWPKFLAALGWKAGTLQAVVDEIGGSEVPKPANPFHRERLALGRIRQDLGATSFHPKEIKAALARRIVTDFHGAAAAQSAQAEFEHVFAQRENPSEIDEVVREISSEGVWLPRLIVELGMARSNGEAIRLIQQGGVTVDGARVESRDHRLTASAPASYLLKVGKRRFVRVRFQ